MNTQRVIEVLTQARELIADEARWTKHSAARTAEGKPVSSRDLEAVAWCAEGAVMKVCGGFNNMARDTLNVMTDTSAVQAYVAAIKHNDGELDEDAIYVSGFNDEQHTDHDDVIRMMTQGIRLAEHLGTLPMHQQGRN